MLPCCGLRRCGDVNAACPSFSSLALVSRWRKLDSLTGLPAWFDVVLSSPLPLFAPLLLALLFRPVVFRCGMFSGCGCCEPIVVTPASEALPALLSA
jgi:hypothetical protein